MGKKGRMMDYKSEQSISKAIFMNFSFLRTQIFSVGLRINDFEQVKIKITNISNMKLANSRQLDDRIGRQGK